jgi:amino acid adenylation domain-containing protein
MKLHESSEVRIKELPLSHGQRGILFAEQLSPNHSTFNIPFVLSIQGNLDKQKLKKSFQKLVNIFPILKSCVLFQEGAPFLSQSTKTPEFSEITFLQEGFSDQKKKIEENILREISRPFDLFKGPLIRAQLIHIGKNYYNFVIVIHHIVCDGWSLGLICEQLEKLYNGEQQENFEDFKYIDFYQSQASYLSSQLSQEQKFYWEEELKNIEQTNYLPYEVKDPKYLSSSFGSVEKLSFDATSIENIATFCKKQQITPFVFFLAVYASLLRQYSQEEFITIGVPITQRFKEGMDKAVGYFVNTVPLIIQFSQDTTFSNILEQVKNKLIQAQNYHEIPFEYILENYKSKRQFPFFQTLFIQEGMNNTPPKLGNLKCEILPTHNQSSKAEISMIIGFEKNKPNLVIEYHSGLFSQFFIRKVLDAYKHILKTAVTNPDHLIDHTLLNSDSYSQIKGSSLTHKLPQSLFHLLQETTQKYPQNIAIEEGKRILTYEQLLKAVEQRAEQLATYDVNASTKVGILQHRSIEAIVNLLALLKLRAVYIPLDPQQPLSRTLKIIKGSQIDYIISSSPYKDNFPSEVTYISSEELKKNKKNFPITLNTDSNSVSDIAYTIHTSGSTGEPKGVLVSHRSLLNTIFGTLDSCSIHNKKIFIAVTALTFDVSLLDYFLPFSVGGKVIIIPQGFEKEPSVLLEHIGYDSDIVIQGTPSFWKLFVAQNKKPTTSKLIMLSAGEALPHSLAKKLLSYGKLYNFYGPTEAAVYTTYKKVEFNERKITIGKPIPNVQVYLLSKNNTLSPMGIPGELYIGGLGVASGYLNRPELTKERFIPNPFDSEDPFPLYKTGDLGRLLPDGNIEFLGRLDHQVKVRGHRVELGEIESVLLKQDSVKSAAVLLIKGEEAGQHSLFAYVVPKGPCEEKNLIPQLRGVLESTLPAYMIPQAFVILDELPLSANGKIDRKALPKIKREHLTQGTFVPPETDVEKKVAQLWQELLSLKKIGKYDNFFQIGGHSLLAVQMINRLQKDLNCSLSLKDFFQNPILSQVSHYVEQNTQKSLSLIPIQDSSQLIPLSFTQQRVWFLQHLFNQKSLYHIPFSVQLSGELELKALEKALCCVANRHNILRTNFVATKKDPVQKVAPPFKKIAIQVEDLSEMTNQQDQKEQVQQILLNHSQLAFDLEKDRLFRVLVLKLSPQEFILSCTFHHLIIDGWSLSLFCEELTAFYNHEVAGNSLRLKELPLQFSDFSFWQKDYDSTSLHYWVKRLDGSPTLSTFPTEKSRPEELSYQGETLSFEISEPLLKKLRNLSDQNQVTLFSTMLATFLLLLYRYTQQDDLVIGLPVANRTHPDLEPLIGFFTNTLAFRLQGVDGATPFKAFLQSLHEQVSEDLDHQETPFEKIVDELDLPRLMNANPLFQVMFSYQAKSEGEIHLSNLKSRPYLTPHKTSKFDTNFFVQDHGSHMSVLIEYATDLYDQKAIKRLGLHYQHLLTQVTEHPSEKIGALEVVTPAERHQILYDWNNKWMEFPKEKTLHQLFEEQVEKTLQAEALCFEDTSLTYEELNQKANQLAHVLLDKGVRAETPVAIALERSFEMVISVLAILKAGGCYVPLDSSMPQERMLFVLEDTKAPFLLAEETNVLEAQYTGEVIVPHEVLHQTNIPQTNPQVQMSSTQLAYIIYTSGSTGKPKGVMIQHLNVVNTIIDINDQYNIGSKDTLIGLSSLTFDLSVFDIFGSLISGARMLILSPDSSKDPLYWLKCLSKYHVTIWNSVPTLVDLLTKAQIQSKFQSSLRLILMSGDWIPVKLKSQVTKDLGENINVISLGGATEGSIWSIQFPITKVDPRWSSIPYGKALRNQSMYILNDFGQLCPFLTVGEIAIGGIGVAFGYHNRPKLNESKFITNNFQNGPQRVYLTGDFGKVHPDGNIEFLGRKDNQIKIRGFRVELDEISYNLRNFDEIKDVVTLPVSRSDGSRYIASYLIPSRYNPEFNEKEFLETIKQKLQKKLPEYMLPSAYHVLKTLPISTNGKVDFKALAQMKTNDDTHAEKDFVFTEKAKSFLQLFRDFFKNEKIGLNSNFFQIGGDSLLAIQLITNAREKGLNFKLKDLFTNPTVGELSRVGEIIGEKQLSKTAHSIKEYYKLAPIQNWLFNQFEQRINSITQHILVNLSDGIEQNRLIRSLKKVLRKNKVFYLKFKKIKKKWKQQPTPKPQYKIETLDLSHLSEQKSRETLEKKLEELGEEISVSGLLSIFLIAKHKKEKLSLSCIVHHLIIDGLSWQILFEDLNNFYYGKDQLCSSSQRFVDYIDCLTEYSNQLDHKSNAPLSLDSFFHTNRFNPKKVGRETLTIDAPLTEKFFKATSNRGNKGDNILAALVYSLNKNFKNFSSITLESLARDRFPSMDFSRTIGWFTTLYPYTFNIDSSEPLFFQIKKILQDVADLEKTSLNYAIENYFKGSSSKLSASLPKIIFNYSGSWNQLPPLYEKLNFIETLERQYKPLFPLEINSFIVDGKIFFKFIFDEEHFNKIFIQELALKIKESIGYIAEKFTTLEPFLETNQQELPHHFPLTPTQQGILFHSLSQPSTQAYIVQSVVEIQGELDKNLIEKALNETVRRHSSLRTVLDLDEFEQSVAEFKELTIEFEGLSSKMKLQQILHQEKNSLKIDSKFLSKFKIIEINKSLFFLVWTSHHIILDGISLGIVLNDIFENYELLCSQKKPLPITTSFQNYVHLMEQKNRKPLQKFWTQYLSSYPYKSNDRSNHSTTAEQKNVLINLDSQQSETLKKIAYQNNVTLSSLLMTVWAMSLAWVQKEEDVVTGLTFSNRDTDIENIHKIVGPLISTVPVRFKLQIQKKTKKEILTFAQNAQKAIGDIYEHSYVSTSDIKSWCKLPQNTPLFEHIFTYQNYGKLYNQSRKINDLEVKLLSSLDQNEFPMTCMVIPDDKIQIQILFNPQRYPYGDVNSISKELLRIIHLIMQT